MRIPVILVVSLLAAALLSGCFANEHDHETNGGGGGTTTTTTTTGATNTTTPTGNRPPAADFTYSPSEPTADDNITFDASGSADPEGDDLAFSWDFGDEATGSGETVVHNYSKSGTYNVTLEVSDGNGGTDTKTVPVSVLAGKAKITPDNETTPFEDTVTGSNPGWGTDSFRNNVALRDTANTTTEGAQKWFKVNVTGSPIKLIVNFTSKGDEDNTTVNAIVYERGNDENLLVQRRSGESEIANPKNTDYFICVGAELNIFNEEIPFFLNVTAAYS